MPRYILVLFTVPPKEGMQKKGEKKGKEVAKVRLKKEGGVGKRVEGTEGKKRNGRKGKKKQ